MKNEHDAHHQLAANKVKLGKVSRDLYMNGNTILDKDDLPALEYLPVNQCEGCMSGLPLIGGLHYSGNTPTITCTKALYV